MGDNLKGKVAVVTGSGQGIGRAIAIGMAQEGARVVTNNRCRGSTGYAFMNDSLINALSEEKREWLRKEVAAISGDAGTTAKTIKDMGGEAVPFFGDVSDFEVARKLIQTAVDSFGKIDILVNVVGTFGFSAVWDMTEELWDHINLIKPKAHFNCIRHALPYMMEQKWGRIINCTSGAFKGSNKHTNYATANAGVLGLTWSVAKEVYQYGITCNAFAPDAKTRATFELEAYVMAVPEKDSPLPGSMFRSISAMTPPPEDLAPFIIYLATEAASHISGSIFMVGGSRIAMFSEPEMQSSVFKYGGRWTVDELKQQVPRGLLGRYRSPAAPMAPP
jgi:3-oxoacyl-[acyl-carrier protein] reductase